VATGTGAIAVRAARAGAVVTASDFSPVLVETAKKLAAEESLPISFDVADAEELPYEDESFTESAAPVST
jgi:ubiquinone/menaquinone biosynthesis C-methylase UbiE